MCDICLTLDGYSPSFIFDRAILDDDDLAAARNYLAQRWGFTRDPVR